MRQKNIDSRPVFFVWSKKGPGLLWSRQNGLPKHFGWNHQPDDSSDFSHHSCRITWISYSSFLKNDHSYSPYSTNPKIPPAVPPVVFVEPKKWSHEEPVISGHRWHRCIDFQIYIKYSSTRTLHYITLHFIKVQYSTVQYSTYIHAYIHAYMHACMHAYIIQYTFIWIYIYICIEETMNVLVLIEYTANQPPKVMNCLSVWPSTLHFR